MQDPITVTMTDEQGQPFTQIFHPERQFTAAGKEYLAVLPDGQDDDVYLFDFTLDEQGAVQLLEIEDDEVYDAVAEAYERLQTQ